MTSVVDICNEGLGHLGSDNQIAAIAPPDGSVEAGYCARFWPRARRELLSRHAWSFALKRATLALNSSNTSTQWAYAYALPPDCLRPVRVPSSTSKVNLFVIPESYPRPLNVDANDDAGATYEREGSVIYTNEPDATLIYVTDITDPNRYSDLFVTAAGYLMGAYLAGPLVRGAAGVKTAQGLRDLAFAGAVSAAGADANGGNRSSDYVPTHLRARA